MGVVGGGGGGGVVMGLVGDCLGGAYLVWLGLLVCGWCVGGGGGGVGVGGVGGVDGVGGVGVLVVCCLGGISHCGLVCVGVGVWVARA